MVAWHPADFHRASFNMGLQLSAAASGNMNQAIGLQEEVMPKVSLAVASFPALCWPTTRVTNWLKSPSA